MMIVYFFYFHYYLIFRYQIYLAILNMLASMTADEAMRFISAFFDSRLLVRLSNGEILSRREYVAAMFKSVRNDYNESLNEETFDEEERKPTFGGWLDLAKQRRSVISRYIGYDLFEYYYGLDSSSECESSDDYDDESQSNEDSDAWSSSTSDWLLGDVLSADYFKEDSSQSQGETLPDWFVNILIKEVWGHLQTVCQL